MLARAHRPRPTSCITTALIPGKRAPILVTAEMVKAMQPRLACIVDLAAEQGGNCALTKPGERIVDDGVTIVGELDLPSHIAVHASQMYSRNMEKLLLHLIARTAALKLDLTDEITAAADHPRRRRGRDGAGRRRRARSKRRSRQHERRLVIFGLYIFVLATFVGYQVITKVPPLLHTPLMAATNAISRHLAGRLAGRGRQRARHGDHRARLVAVTAATINVVGGFMITDRMLQMFKKGARRRADDAPTTSSSSSATWSRRCSSSSACAAWHRRRPRGAACTSAEVGMLLAVVGTLLHHEIITLPVDHRRPRCSARRSAPIMALQHPMTKMPERIALSHAFGGLAVALVGISEYLHRSACRPRR